MKITHCKLNKSIQNKLLEFFVLEVTARAVADLLGIQANSAIFYWKIREVISYHLALEADEVVDSQIEHDEIYLSSTVQLPSPDTSETFVLFCCGYLLFFA